MGRQQAVLPWGDTLLDQSLDDWTVQGFTHAEFMTHIIDGGSLDAPAITFTCPNQGRTLRWLMDRAIDLGLGIILNGDIYMGTGRSDDDGSAPGPGRYHNTWADGGDHPYGTMVNNIVRWPAKYRQAVVAFQFLNEPHNAQWLADWIRGRIETHRGQIRGQGWEVIGSGQPMHLDTYGDLLTATDPHGVWYRPGQAADRAAQIAGEWPDLPQWWTELLGANPEDTLEISRAVASAPNVEMVSMFGGHSMGDWYNASYEWNFANRIHHSDDLWMCQSALGQTIAGDEWSEFMGVEDDGGQLPPPVEPPPGEGTIKGRCKKIQNRSTKKLGKTWQAKQDRNTQRDCEEIIRLADG